MKRSAQRHKPVKNQSYFYGIHAVKALLTYRPSDALVLFVQNGDIPNQAIDDIVQTACTLGVAVQLAHKDSLSELCANVHHQGVVLQARLAKFADDSLLDTLCQKPDALFLLLDQITDSHNFGACLRTACAMGVDAVIIPKHQSAKLFPSVAKVSVGASEIIPVLAVSNFAQCLTQLKQQGVFVFGTALDETATACNAGNFLGKVALVMGSEGSGMRRLTQELCDTLIYIPMTDLPRPQSLNVSVATGMVLYEIWRQRSASSFP